MSSAQGVTRAWLTAAGLAAVVALWWLSLLDRENRLIAYLRVTTFPLLALRAVVSREPFASALVGLIVGVSVLRATGRGFVFATVGLVALLLYLAEPHAPRTAIPRALTTLAGFLAALAIAAAINGVS